MYFHAILEDQCTFDFEAYKKNLWNKNILSAYNMNLYFQFSLC